MLKKIMLSTILTMLSLMALNGVAAIGERIAYGAFWVDGKPEGLYMHQSGQRPQLRPNANLDGWLYQISINHLGFRGTAPTTPKSDKHIRIWCIGGSTTFDIYAPTDALTWPAQLQTVLQEQHPDKVIEVINAGIPGEVYDGSLSDLKQLAPEIQPDWVVLYHGPNDLREILSLKQPTNNSLPPTLSQRGDFALLRILKRNFQQNRIAPVRWSENSFQSHHYDELERRVQLFVQGIQQLNIKPIFTTHAFRATPTDTGKIARQNVGETTLLFQQTPEDVIKSIDGYNQLMTTMAEQYNAPLADIRAAVPSDSKYWGDATHFLAPGSKIAGETLSQTLSPQLQ